MLVYCKTSRNHDTHKFTATFKDATIPETSKHVLFEFVRYMIAFDEQRDTSDIKHLRFENCIISSIPDYIFARLKNLATIDVIGSTIKNINLYKIKQLQHIEKLSLQKSIVEDHKGTAFENIKELVFYFDRTHDSSQNCTIKFKGKIELSDLVEKEEVKSRQMDQNNPITEVFPPSTPFTLIFQDTPPITPVNKTNSESKVSSLDHVRRVIDAKHSHQHVQSQFSFGSSPVRTSGFNFGSPAEASTLSKSAVSDQSSIIGSTSSNQDAAQSIKKEPSPTKTFDFGFSTLISAKKLEADNANMSKELKVLKEQVLKLEAENNELKKNGVLLDLKRIFNDEVFKDFEVNVNDEKSYKVHKILFAARSSVIADMIRNTPDANSLDLQDIPLPIFDILLDFIYNDTLPENDERLIEIYAAAGKLNIVELKNTMSLRLMDKICDKNSFKILELSNKYGNDELRMKAFEDIKKALSNYNLPDELSTNPEKVKILLDLKKKMDEEFEKIQREIGLGHLIDEEHWNDAAGSPGGNNSEYEAVEEN